MKKTQSVATNGPVLITYTRPVTLLYAWRQVAQLTQDDLAALAACSTPGVRLAERGVRCGANLARRLARATGLDVGELVKMEQAREWEVDLTATRPRGPVPVDRPDWRDWLAAHEGELPDLRFALVDGFYRDTSARVADLLDEIDDPDAVGVLYVWRPVDLPDAQIAALIDDALDGLETAANEALDLEADSEPLVIPEPVRRAVHRCGLKTALRAEARRFYAAAEEVAVDRAFWERFGWMEVDHG